MTPTSLTIEITPDAAEREYAKPIEEAARAIYEDRNGRGCKPWSRLPGTHRENYRADARAAWAALVSHGWITDLGLTAMAKENGE